MPISGKRPLTEGQRGEVVMPEEAVDLPRGLD